MAWVGSIVVSTNLLPGLITFHVIVALVIICNVVLCYDISSNRLLVYDCLVIQFA